MYKQGGVAGPAQKGQRSQQVTKPILNTHKTNIMVLDESRERKEDFVLDGENI